MKTLPQAVQDYLAMRRALGYQLLNAGPALEDFVSFLKRKRTSYITITIALKWAQKAGAQPATWANRLIDWHWFAVSPDIAVLLILERRFLRQGYCHGGRNERLHTCIQTMRCACC